MRNEHLRYEQLSPYVENTLDETERELIDIHLKGCAQCRGDLQHFTDYRREIEPELAVRYAPRAPRSWRAKLLSLGSWPPAGLKPVYAMAIVVMSVGAVFFTLMLLQRHRTSNEQAKLVEPGRITEATPAPAVKVAVTPPVERAPAGETAPTASGAASNRAGANYNSSGPTASRSQALAVQTRTSRTRQRAEGIVVLNDGVGKVVLDSSGNVTGLGNVSAETQRSVSEVLLAQEIKRPEVLRDVLGESSTLRGAPDKGSSFQLLWPERTVVMEDRPTFRWEPLKGASMYQVHVVDSHHHVVAQSPELPSTTTEWTPASPLRRGVVYTWVVTAIVNGEEITSPAASAPEMRFKVLEAEKVSELNRLQGSSRSHLALGVFYARAGMVREAEREFQMLVKENPQSRLALKLLRSVQSWH